MRLALFARACVLSPNLTAKARRVLNSRAVLYATLTRNPKVHFPPRRQAELHWGGPTGRNASSVAVAAWIVTRTTHSRWRFYTMMRGVRWIVSVGVRGVVDLRLTVTRQTTMSGLQLRLRQQRRGASRSQSCKPRRAWWQSSRPSSPRSRVRSSWRRSAAVMGPGQRQHG